ncbi:hypothetical protein MMC25_007415 [Agyrium rufum]|nr:hypothetical protein [Agyrium rufum]
MLYVEQPVGVGFSQGTPDSTDEISLAKEFMGFYKHFAKTFETQGYEVYLAGESCAGRYIPYVAKQMLDANDTTYFNVSGIMIYSPALGDSNIEYELTVIPHTKYFNNVIGLNDTLMNAVSTNADACNYTSYMDTCPTFPTPGQFPPSPDLNAPSCDVADDVYNAAILVNPCFDAYHVTDGCPFAWSVVGDLAYGANPPSAQVWFNRSDVQAAINAPSTSWVECASENVFPGPNGNNTSDRSHALANNGVLQSVIELINNTIIGNGLLDWLVPANATLMVL